MKYTIDQTKQTCAYLQLYEQLRDDIVREHYPYGTRLPSKRLLAEETGVSVITVQHALEILCDEGYVQTRERSGCFVIYRRVDFYPAKETASPQARPPQHHHADTAFPFSVLAKTMRGVLSKYGDQILVKSPNLGSPVLRTSLAAYLARSKGI